MLEKGKNYSAPFEWALKGEIRPRSHKTRQIHLSKKGDEKDVSDNTGCVPLLIAVFRSGVMIDREISGEIAISALSLQSTPRLLERRRAGLDISIVIRFKKQGDEQSAIVAISN